MNVRYLMTRLAGMDDEGFEAVQYMVTRRDEFDMVTFLSVVAEMRAVGREQEGTDEPAT